MFNVDVVSKHSNIFLVSIRIHAAFILIYAIIYQREESEEGEGGGLLGSTRGLADDGKRLDFLSPRGPLHTECQRQLLHPKSLNDLYIISKGGGLEGGRLVPDWKGPQGWRMSVLGSGPPKQCSHVGKTHFVQENTSF